MRRVHYYRPEADDPLVLAKAVIDQAIFEREAARLGLSAAEDEGCGDGQVGWYVECPTRLALSDLLTRLRDCGLPLLEVTVSDEDELIDWQEHELNRHFCFDIPRE